MKLRETHKPGGGRYVPGARWKECPRCGFDYLDIDLVYEERTADWVCKRCYDPPTRDEERTGLRV